MAAASFALKGIFGYGGLLIGLRRGKGITPRGVFQYAQGQGFEENLKILDTSGYYRRRIATSARRVFIEGIFIVPHSS